MSIDNRDYMIERYLKREGIRALKPFEQPRHLSVLKKFVLLGAIANVLVWGYLLLFVM